jgi:hypothetical protein
MNEQFCATLANDIAVAFQALFDAGMFYGAGLFFLGWLTGGGVETICYLVRSFRSKGQTA